MADAAVEPTVVLSSSVAGPGEQRFCFCGHRRFDAGFSRASAVRAGAAAADAGLHPDLSIGAGDQRHGHRRVPARPAAIPADGRVDRAGGRLSVHGPDVDPARPDLSRLFAYRAIGCRSADHGVALYVLAWRLSALRHRLRGLRHGRWRSSFEATRDGCRAHTGHCRRLRRRTPRHAGAGDLAADHAGQSAHGEYERRGVESVAVEPRRVGDAGAAAAVFGAGSVAHRDDVRVVVRHCG